MSSRYNDAAHSDYWKGVKYKTGSRFYKDDAQLRRSYRPWLRWLPCGLLWALEKLHYHHYEAVEQGCTVLLCLLGLLVLVGVFLAGKLW